MRIANLKRSSSGATAIEYAVIAGIVGLGLVGSLVTTRGSLSAVFGTASSSMASATATSDSSTPTSPTSPTSPGSTEFARAAYWNAKTLSGPPVKTTQWGRDRVIYNFTDGTRVEYYYSPDSSVQSLDITVGTSNLNYYFDGDGKFDSGKVQTYTSGTTSVASSEFGTVSSLATNTTTFTTNGPGPTSSSTTGPASAAFISSTATMMEDIKFFKTQPYLK